jgi:competence protein ComEC
MLFYLLCSAWILGIVLGRALPLGFLQWLALAAIALAAVILFRRVKLYRLAFSALAILFAGAVRLQLQLPQIDASHVSFYNNLRSEVRLTGVIASDPEAREGYTRFQVKVERIRIPALELAAPVDGLVLVHASRLTEWRYGDWVRVYGELEEPPGDLDFDYARVLANEGIYSWMPSASLDLLEHGHGNPLLSAIYRLRAHLLRVIMRNFPDPEAQLMAGILLGVEGGISRSTREAFNKTGTTHIIAISGFNLTLLAQASIRLSGRWLGRRRGAVAAIALILAYTVMVGADPPVVRAAIMASFGLIAGYIGRVSQAVRSLAWAGLTMSLFNPLSIYEAGFQLSFAATLGLIFYAEPLQHGLQRLLDGATNQENSERISAFLSEYALFTLAAQLTTLPITATAFHRLSVIAVPVNILVLPLQPALMLTGGMAMILGAVSAPLGQAAAWAAWPFPAATIGVVQASSRLPSSSVPLGRLSILFPILYYAGLSGFTLSVRWLQTRLRPNLQAVLQSLRRKLAVVPLLSVLFALTLLTWHAYTRRPDGRLHIRLLDVGQGQAILIRSPGGRSVLMHGGSSPLRLSERMSPYFSIFDHHIDWLIAAGNEYPQIGGLLGIGERFPVENALLYDALSGNVGERLVEELTLAGVPMAPAVTGMSLDLGSGASLNVLDSGDRGLAFSLEYGAFRALILPGAEPEMLARLADGGSLLHSTAVILPACGDARLVPPEWIAQFDGTLLTSCEAGVNQSNLDEYEGRLLRTDLHGDIELESDGATLWVEVTRKP